MVCYNVDVEVMIPKINAICYDFPTKPFRETMHSCLR